MSNSTIAGKSVLITGANGGIGQALVQAFAAAGARIAAATRTPGANTGATRSIVLDVADDASVARARDELGPMDILVNNAGVNANKRLFASNAMADARAEMEVNYFGLLRMADAFAPMMRERKSGVIANVLTVLSHVNLPLSASYCASKAAAQSITQALRAELSPHGIHVCGLFPGAVDTRMSAKSPPPKITPAEVAAALIEAIHVGSNDVFIGPAKDLHARWRQDPAAVEKMMAGRLPAPAP